MFICVLETTFCIRIRQPGKFSFNKFYQFNFNDLEFDLDDNKGFTTE